MLDSVSLFADLSREERDHLAKRAVLKTYPRNTILVSEGDETDSLYVIESGKVKVFLSDEEGRELVLTIQGPGEYFGEIALLDASPRSASVMTVESCRLWVVSKRDFDECLEANPGMALALLKGLARRMRALTDNAKSLALMDVYGRIARTLLSMAQSQDGQLVIPQKLTQRDIASMVGASREMVSRIMKDLTAGGYITVERTRILIHEKLPASW